MFKKLTLASILLLATLIMAGCSSEASSNNASTNTDTNSQTSGAEKVVVANFHGTRRCASCETVGKYAEETIDKRFKKEQQEGKVVFRSINGQLPENRDMVQKYQARGSSLYINAIRDGEDDIREEMRVWRLTNNKDQFMDYLEGEIKESLNQ
jgi:ABC-type glycerol-3-phosphate transport system substrate-binding protein